MDQLTAHRFGDHTLQQATDATTGRFEGLPGCWKLGGGRALTLHAGQAGVLQIAHGRDAADRRDGVLVPETEPAHAGVNLHVDSHRLFLTRCLPLEPARFVERAERRHDVVPHRRLNLDGQARTQ